MPGWATAFMNLQLRIDKTQAERDIGSIDTATAGSRAGRTYSDAFSRNAQGRLRDAQGKFVSDAAASGSQAGQRSGTGFSSAFRQLTADLSAAVFRGRFSSGPGRSDATQAGEDAGNVFGAAFSRAVSSLLSGGGGGGGFLSRLGSQAGGRGIAGGIASGIGPNILGLSVLGKAGVYGGAGALGLGALPALLGGLAPLAVGGLGAGAGAALFSQAASPALALVQAQAKAQAARQAAVTPAQQKAAAVQAQAVQQQAAGLSPAEQSLAATITRLQGMWQKFTQSFAPLFAQAIRPIPALFSSLLPALTGFFSQAVRLLGPFAAGLGDIARLVLPELGRAFAAAGPLIRPLLDGLGQLAAGVLPGLVALIRAAGPEIGLFASILGSLGRNIGGLFTQLAPAVRASMPLLQAVLGLVGALLPVVGQLAGIMASALGPAFAAFAKVVESLLPVLLPIGRVIGELAAAVLGDLAAALTAVATLFRSIAPALDVFVKSLGAVFVMLENSGVWATLGDALEKLAKPLGQLISALLTGLAPILPPVIALIGQVSAILAAGLASAVAAVLPPLTRLATEALGAIAVVLPVVVPLLTALTRIFTAVVVRAVADLATALAAIISAIPPGVLQGIVIGLAALIGGLRLLGLGIAAVSALAGLSPFGWILIAIAAIAVGIVELATHWHQVWGAIRGVAADFARWLESVWRIGIVQDILAVWSFGLIPLATHWHDVWANIRNWTADFWQWLSRVFGGDIGGFLTRTIPGWYDTALAKTRQWWTDIENAFTAGWNAVYSHTIGPMITFFTATLPNSFSAAVTGIGRFWSSLGQTVQAPVRFVIDDVLDGLISVFDTITSAVGLGKPIPQVHPFGLAAGGKITAGTGPVADDVLLRASKDETVVSAEHSALLAPIFAALGIAGYARGGRVISRPGAALLGLLGVPGLAAGGAVAAGQDPPSSGGGGFFGTLLHGAERLGHDAASVISKALDIGKITAALATGNTTALTNAFTALTGKKIPAGGALLDMLTQLPKTLVKDLVGWLMGSAGGASGSSIANYAMSFLGRIPYVWGGTQVPGGADCSGFVQAIYKHFGVNAPRTSEAQGAWVKRASPQVGGLAFYHSPPGGPDPGHVAIIRTASQVISQGGGMGPQLMAINALPLLWTGIPPGGLGGGGGPTSSGYWINIGRQMAAAYGWTGAQFTALNKLWTKESGWDPAARNPMSGAAGIPQDISGNMHGGGRGQIAWGLAYVRSRYGDPAAAWAHEVADNWYDRGGWINEPVLGVGRYSGALYGFGGAGREYVTPEAGVAGGDPGFAVLAGQLDTVIGLLASGPGRTAAGMAAAVAAPARVAAHAAWIGSR